MRSMVEGVCGGSVRSPTEQASPPTPLPPRYRAVPLPRFAGQDGRYHATKTERAGVAVSAAG